MGINEDSGEVISLELAQEMVNEFRSKYPDLPKGFFVGKSNIKLILDQKDCIGIRSYNGIDDKTGKQTLVLVGVGKDLKDMTDGYILDRAVPCPTDCDKDSPLNI